MILEFGLGNPVMNEVQMKDRTKAFAMEISNLPEDAGK